MYAVINTLYQTLSLLILFSVSLTAHALQQIYTDIPGEQHKVNISTDTLTRIAINGDRINKIISDSSRFITETDAISGAIFIRAKDNNAFPLFLTTESGNTYHLLLTPQALDADNIEIIPSLPEKADHWGKLSPYAHKITQLIKGMVNHTLPSGYHKLPDKKMPMPLSNHPIKARIQTIYQGKHLQGIVLTLTNTGKTTISLEPTLLTQAGVLAIAFSNTHLAPQQTITAYQVRLRDNNHVR